MLTICVLVNEALKQKFLDLKEGAIVVSLKCLMGSGRTTARNGITRERSASPALKERNVSFYPTSFAALHKTEDAAT